MPKSPPPVAGEGGPPKSVGEADPPAKSPPPKSPPPVAGEGEPPKGVGEADPPAKGVSKSPPPVPGEGEPPKGVGEADPPAKGVSRPPPNGLSSRRVLELAAPPNGLLAAGTLELTLVPKRPEPPPSVRLAEGVLEASALPKRPPSRELRVGVLELAGLPKVPAGTSRLEPARPVKVPKAPTPRFESSKRPPGSDLPPPRLARRGGEGLLEGAAVSPRPGGAGRGSAILASSWSIRRADSAADFSSWPTRSPSDLSLLVADPESLTAAPTLSSSSARVTRNTTPSTSMFPGLRARSRAAVDVNSIRKKRCFVRFALCCCPTTRSPDLFSRISRQYPRGGSTRSPASFVAPKITTAGFAPPRSRSTRCRVDSFWML